MRFLIRILSVTEQKGKILLVYKLKIISFLSSGKQKNLCIFYVQVSTCLTFLY